MIDFTKEQMFREISYRIKRKNPTSIVRYGDGEAMVLNGFKDMATLKMVMKRQLGEVPSVDHIEQLRANLIEAYRTADIIGVPVNKRLDQPESYWYKAFGILVEHVGIEYLQKKQLTNIDFHLHFLDEGHFDTLLTGLDTLCYISCRNLDEEIKNHFKIKNIWSYIIAPEAKFTSGYEGMKHFPDQFNEIRRWVTKVPVQGNVCLIGAGYVGKIYAKWFKDHGGIAIDVGCVMDLWSGKATRGPDRGMDKINDQFKI